MRIGKLAPMTSFTRLIETLHLELKAAPEGALLVAYSGGLDSTVLLHALANIASARNLRAIHVNHALHPQSPRWAEHCNAFAAALQVPISVISVQVPRAGGEGLESAARRARYAAFAANLIPGELLTLAQHRDDQIETVLLKLVRGAGPEGLGAMRTLRDFEQGYLWRPLLAAPRAVLQAYAQANNLTWIEDPSNLNRDFDRNYLRHDIIPRLHQRWPQMDTAITHSLTWNQAAADFIAGEAQRALVHIRDENPAALHWRDWLNLPAALRDPALRLWLRELGLPAPTHLHVQELMRQVQAAGDREPCVRWPGVELRRYRDRLYAMRPLQPIPYDWQHRWNGEPLTLPADCGVLRLASTADQTPFDGNEVSLPSCTFWVRFRHGGERLKLKGATYSKDLRTVFQEAGIAPWERGRIPLVFSSPDETGTLLAIGDHWLSEEGANWLAHQALRLQWTRSSSLL